MQYTPTNKRHRTGFALCAGLFLSTSATAAVTPFPTPPPSAYADTESSTNIALTGWTDLTRRFHVELLAQTTPSNCIQLAYGTDADNNHNLAPEETALRLGFDCGEEFICDEKGDATSITTQPTTNHQQLTTSTLDLSRLFNRDWDLVKVTTRGTFALPPVIKAAYRNNPLVFILK